MKIYRVENRYTQPESCGFSYYTQKADALKELAKNKNSDTGVEIKSYLNYPVRTANKGFCNIAPNIYRQKYISSAMFFQSAAEGQHRKALA